MVPTRLAILACTAFLAASLSAGQALAQSGELLIRQGVEARKAGKDREALGKFKQAYELLHSPRSAAQLGLCEHALKDPMNASTHLTEALAASSDVWVSANRGTLTKALKDTQANLVDVTVTGGPPGAAVFINGGPAGQLPATGSTFVLPGKITVEVRAPNHVELREDYSRAAGEPLQVLAELKPTQLEVARPIEDPVLPVTAIAATPGTEPEGSPKMRLAGAIVGGVGVASMLAGGFYALRVSSLSDEARNADVFDPGRNDKLDSSETGQYVFLGLGAAALVVGGVLYWMGSK